MPQKVFLSILKFYGIFIQSIIKYIYGLQGNLNDVSFGNLNQLKSCYSFEYFIKHEKVNITFMRK